jgi:STE24 endopeptidase
MIISILFFGIIGFVSDIITLPFSYYSQFVIEAKFGFNKTTKTTFLMDKLKGYILVILIAVPIFWLIATIYYQNQSSFWWMCWIIMSTFTLLASTLYSTLILPLFNKLKPLEEGELKNAITQYCKQNNFSLKKVLIMDGSKRSTKANAFFSGIGQFKTIVLYDTLIEKLSTQEIVSVLAHEVGHYKKNHIIYSMIIGIITTGISFYVFSLFLGNELFAQCLGGTKSCLHLEIISISLIFSPVNFITGWAMNTISQKNEFEADDYAKKTSSGIDLANALKKLSIDALNSLNPHPLFVKLYYSHPPLNQRLKNLYA